MRVVMIVVLALLSAAAGTATRLTPQEEVLEASGIPLDKARLVDAATMVQQSLAIIKELDTNTPPAVNLEHDSDLDNLSPQVSAALDAIAPTAEKLLPVVLRWANSSSPQFYRLVLKILEKPWLVKQSLEIFNNDFVKEVPLIAESIFQNAPAEWFQHFNDTDHVLRTIRNWPNKDLTTSKSSVKDLQAGALVLLETSMTVQGSGSGKQIAATVFLFISLFLYFVGCQGTTSAELQNSMKMNMGWRAFDMICAVLYASRWFRQTNELLCLMMGLPGTCGDPVRMIKNLKEGVDVNLNIPIMAMQTNPNAQF
jgi:hypothetical protein